MADKTIVKVEDYCKMIKKVPVLSHIDMELSSGKIYGFKGKNGSGKTMLMRAICGLILPTNGHILINGEELGKDISFPRSIGALLENPSFLNQYNGFKNLQLIAGIQKKIGEEQIRDSLIEVGLEPDDKRTYRKYSLGMKQRLGIAAAIMEEADIIILDEPINALDESGAALVRTIIQKLRNQGSLVIIACHDTEELKFLSDEIYTLSDGKVISHEQIQNLE